MKEPVAKLPPGSFDFLRDHFGWLSTLTYLGVTGIGVIYEFWFFRSFGIAILDYGQPVDYLLAGFREPILFLLTLLSILILSLIYRLDVYVRSKSARYAKSSDLLEAKRWYSRSAVFVTLALLYFVVFAWAYASYSANQVAKGHARHVLVHLTNDPDEKTILGESVLIGTTSQFVFLLRTDTSKVEVVPINAIARIEQSIPDR